MTHDYAVTKVEPVRNQLAETLAATPMAAKVPAAAMRFPTRTWQALLCNSRRSHQPDFAWIVMSEEVNPAPVPESRVPEHQQGQTAGTTAGARPYELLLLAILLFAVMNYVAWQEAKAYWQPTPAAVPEPATAMQADEVVLVEVEVDPTALDTLPVPYRSKHFYRRVAGTWQSIAPAAVYWGDRHTLETDYFRLEFTQHDAPVAAAVATELDAILRTLHRQVGLEPPSLHQKLMIQVLPDPWYHWRPLDPFSSPTALLVSSPTLLPIPTPFTEADMLQSDIIRHLATLTLFHKMAATSREAWWGSPDVQGVLRWLIDQGQAGSVVLPRHKRVSSTWQQPWADNPPPSLADISMPYPQLQKHNTSWIENDWLPELDRQTLLVESVIEYALTTYGQEYLPPLIEAIRRQEAWTESVQAIFGVSVEMFERGWHESLTNQRRQW